MAASSPAVSDRSMAWSTATNPASPGSEAVAGRAADLNDMLATPDRPTRGGLQSTPGGDVAVETPPGKPTLATKPYRRLNAMSPATFKANMPPTTPMKSSLKSPMAMKASPTTTKSPAKAMKSVMKSQPASKGSKGSNKKKLAMKRAMKTSSSSSSKTGPKPSSIGSRKKVMKAVLKNKTVMKSTKGAKFGKKPAANIRKKPGMSQVSITVGDERMVMLEQHGHDIRDAEGDITFWSKNNPQELKEFLTTCYQEWVVIYDYNTSYIINGVHVEADTWPVWARNELEGADWVLVTSRGKRERWEKAQ